MMMLNIVHLKKDHFSHLEVNSERFNRDLH